jgi:signal transduction histidine kinase
MKLAAKLTLAFLLVSLIAIGLASLFISVSTSMQFSRYLVDQRQARFVSVATSYYEAHGNWAGVDTALRAEGLLPPLPKPGATPPPPQPFALVDQNRTVIIASGDFQPDTKIQKGVLAKGIGIEVGGVVVGTVVTTGQSPTRSPIEDRYLASVNQSLLIAALGDAVIAFFLALLLARTLTRPVRELTAATRALAHGKLEQQVPVRSADELGELARSFNLMSADLTRSNQARRQMTADIAHDLRNPLTVIGGYLESLKDGKLAATPERFETMQGEVRHLQNLVEDLRTLSLADAGDLVLHFQAVSPRELLQRTAAAYAHQAQQQDVHIRVDAEVDLPDVKLDPERMEQVLGNLVGNALRYTAAGGQISLAARREQGNLLLRVTDNGSGIAEADLPYIFERSYRGDESRSGTESGLGLAIARSIVELHGGSIRAQSGIGEGTQFAIVLPAPG